VALSGEGKVIWIKDFNPAEPQRPHGMGVQFTRVDPASRETLNRILRAKGGGQTSTGARPPSQPMRPLGSHGGTNGTGSKPHVDTSVDLAAEYKVDDTTLRLTVERYRMGAGRASEDEIESLLKPDAPEPPPTLAQALSELPRMLDPTLRRRTGAFRALEVHGASEKPAAAPVAEDPAKPSDPSDDES
jgi:hypothetical protein